MGKLKPTLFERIFQKDKYKSVLTLRSQIEHMTTLWRNIDIVTQLQYYRDVNHQMYRFTMFTLDEERMGQDLGESAVIERLTNDRNKILILLKSVREIDLSDIQKQIREEKLNGLGL